jgi:hypothetical protein
MYKNTLRCNNFVIRKMSKPRRARWMILLKWLLVKSFKFSAGVMLLILNLHETSVFLIM